MEWRANELIVADQERKRAGARSKLRRARPTLRAEQAVAERRARISGPDARADNGRGALTRLLAAQLETADEEQPRPRGQVGGFYRSAPILADDEWKRLGACKVAPLSQPDWQHKRRKRPWAHVVGQAGTNSMRWRGRVGAIASTSRRDSSHRLGPFARLTGSRDGAGARPGQSDFMCGRSAAAMKLRPAPHRCESLRKSNIFPAQRWAHDCATLKMARPRLARAASESSGRKGCLSAALLIGFEFIMIAGRASELSYLRAPRWEPRFEV